MPKQSRPDMLTTSLDMLITYESQGHHEMGPQTSYKQKKTTILQHFSRPESWYHSFPQIMKHNHSKHRKKHFSKNEKKVPQIFLGGRGAKPPGWKERLLKQVNISFLIMSKPFQSCLNLSKHVKNLLKLEIIIFMKNYQKLMNLIPN